MTKGSAEPEAVRRQCPQCATPAARASSRYCQSCGTPLVPDDQRAPVTRERLGRKGKRRLLVVAAVIGVGVLVAGGLRVTESWLYGPEQPVDELLALVEDKRGSEISELLDIDSPLLNDEALAKGYTPPADMEVVGWDHGLPGQRSHDETRRPERDTATVKVRYRVADKAHTTEVSVEREPYGWVRGWEIIPGTSVMVGSVRVASPHVQKARVGGREIDVGEAEDYLNRSGGHTALVGSYGVTFDGDRLFKGGEVGTVDVSAGLPGEHPPSKVAIDDVEVQPGLSPEVTRRVNDHLDECAASTKLRPPGCPFRVERESFFTVDQAAWTITQRPQLDLSLNTDKVSSDPIRIETKKPGTAEVSYTYKNVGPGDEQHENVEFSVSGYVKVDEDGKVDVDL